MQGDFKMLRKVLLLAICSNVHGSGVHHLDAPIGSAPVVTAASSQYFQRTFNRLVAAPPLIPVAPAPHLVPIAPAPPLLHVAPAPQLVPVGSAPPVYVQTPQALPAPLPPQVIPFQAVQPAQNVPIQPTQPPQPAQPVEPNVAIAIATAHAAPVATILLPPYPFGFPPGYGLIPQDQPSNVDTKTKDPEQTTTATTTQVDFQTTLGEPETTTPLPPASDTNFDQASSNQDVNFNQFLRPVQPSPQPQPSNEDVNFRQYLAPAPPRPQAQPSNQNVNFRQYLAPAVPRPQAQPSNQNVNFRQYLAPAAPRPQSQPANRNVNFRQYLAPASQRPQLQPQPQLQLPYALPNPLPHHHHHHDHHPHLHLHAVKPQKLKTIVEVVKAPLAYIAPPPMPQFSHNHEAIKVVKHVHTFVPTKAKLIIRPVNHHHTRSIPVKVFEYKASAAVKASPRVQNVRPGISREAELTTFRPFPIPNSKPPRI